MDLKQVKSKLVGAENERAVSPVIGVILMVAITVILAAVIAAFVLDMGNMSESANAGVDFGESGDEVSVQVIDAGNTDAIYVEVDNGSTTEYINASDGTSKDPWTVGDSGTLRSNSSGLGTGDYNGSSLSGTLSGITVYGEVGGEEQVVASWDA